MSVSPNVRCDGKDEAKAMVKGVDERENDVWIGGGQLSCRCDGLHLRLHEEVVAEDVWSGENGLAASWKGRCGGGSDK